MPRRFANNYGLHKYQIANKQCIDIKWNKFRDLRVDCSLAREWRVLLWQPRTQAPPLEKFILCPVTHGFVRGFVYMCVVCVIFVRMWFLIDELLPMKSDSKYCPDSIVGLATTDIGFLYLVVLAYTVR